MGDGGRSARGGVAIYSSPLGSSLHLVRGTRSFRLTAVGQPYYHAEISNCPTNDGLRGTEMTSLEPSVLGKLGG